MSMDTLRFEARDRVGYLTLARPGRLNSLTPAVLDDLDRALDEAAARDDLRALVIAGEGRAFCVGMDHDFLAACFDDVPGVFEPFCARYHAVLRRLETGPTVVIAAVDGLARAGGFELLIACDLVVATTRARVADHHVTFGMIPGAGATPRAVRKLGDQRARELLLTGRWLAGQEIADCGLALRVVAPGELDAAVEELAARLRPLQRPALARLKRLVNDCADLPLADGLARELAEFRDYHATEPTSADGFRAWQESRS